MPEFLTILIVIACVAVYIYKGVNDFYISEGRFSPIAFRSKRNIQQAAVHLAVKIILCDSRNFKEKRALIGGFLKKYLEFDFDVTLLLEMISAATRQRLNHISVATWLAPSLTGSNRKKVVELLFQIAKTDGIIGLREEKVLLDVTAAFGIDKEWIENIILSHRRAYAEQESRSRETYRAEPATNRSAHLTVLGLQSGAELKQIRKKYRELVMKFHPDKFHNHSAAAKHEAHQRFIEIQEAYETLTEQ